MSIVDFLLGNQSGLLLGYLREPAVGKVSDLVGGLGLLDLISRPRHFCLTAIQCCLGPSTVIRHFGDLQRRQQLASLRDRQHRQ